MAGDREQDTLVLHLLGEPRILYEKTSLTKPLARKEQALLIYLACQADQRFSREHLATLLWGEMPQSSARYNLRRALWHIRRTINQVGLPAEACLVTEGSWICVPSTAPCWVDVRDFEEVLQACFQDPQSRFSIASEGIRRIRRALDLYGGDFLARFSIAYAPNFEEWLTFERERLFLLLLRALTSLIQGFIARGEQDEAIAACQRLLVLDPLQEDIHRLLMRLYWETGQRAQALRQYRTYQDLLQRELGIEPLEDTQALYQRILQHETTPAASASSLVLTSRLTPPSPPHESLARPRLLSLLDRGLAVRLTLLSAPPGYGKTTLMAQWLAERFPEHTSPHPNPPPPEREGETLVAWYKVSEADNTPGNFVEGLAAAIARLHPAVGLDLQEDIRGLITMQKNPQQAVGPLVGALASLEPTPFVLVLDDLERLTNPSSHGVLQHMLEHLPANGHLYLLTRVDPLLPLPRLRVRGQLLEIRAAELRFTDDEMTTFLKQAAGLSLNPAEIAELATRAEGWVAPLWLAANALSRFTASLDDVWEGLFAYLRDEVLTPQPPEVHTFLLRSAVLDRLSPSLCQSVLDMPQDNLEHTHSPADWLVTLEQRNLFLQRAAPRTPHAEPQYTYHPLFLAFLRSEMAYRLSNTEIEALHRRATKAWEQQGELEQALSHCLQTGDEIGIARLLEQIAPTYSQEDRLESLARWLDQLEPAARDQHPRLTLSAGQLRQAEGRIEEARRLYSRAASDFKARQDNVAHGDSLLALAELELLRGRYAEGIELGQQAMTHWDETDSRQHARALRTIGQLQACRGDLADAETSLKQAEHLITDREHPMLAFRISRTQAWVAYLQGTYHRAVGLNRLAEQEAGHDVPPEVVATFLNPVPAILREWGEIEVAWEATQRRLEAARQIQDHLALSHAYTDLGNLHLDRAQSVEAEEAFYQAIAEAKAAGEDGLHRLYGEVHLVYAHFLQDRAMEASEVAEAALRRCQARDASPLELALARIATALTHIRGPGFSGNYELAELLEIHRIFDRLGARFGAFVSAALIGAAHLAKGARSGARSGTGTLTDHQSQARHYAAKALALAAAEGYVQTIVTAREAVLPLMLFALREGLESRFVSQVLARMGPDALAGITEMTQAAEPSVRRQTIAALEMIGAQQHASDRRETALAALEALTHDPDPEVRAAAGQACRDLRSLDEQSAGSG